MKASEKYFSFIVKTEFKTNIVLKRGVVMYLDSENWLKGSIEYENEEFQHLGSRWEDSSFKATFTHMEETDCK